MVCTEKTRLVKLRLVERLAVTALTQWRQNADRSMMVAPLAHCVRAAMEEGRHSTIIDVLHQPVDNLTMREFYRLVFL